MQDWIVTPQLKSTAGLAGVDSLGGYTKEYLVVPDIQRMAAMRLTLQDLATALERNNTSAGAASSTATAKGWRFASDGRVRNADELARTVVATRESVPILLSQIATVRTGQALRMGSASENGHEVVVGTAVMRIGENSRTVVDRRCRTADGDRPLAAGRRRREAGARTAPSWSTRRSRRSPATSPKARCWSSSCCSCCSAISARR